MQPLRRAAAWARGDRSRYRRLLVPAGLGLCTAALAVAPAGSADSGRHQLHGTQPTWTAAVAQTATVPAAHAETAKVWLAPRNASQLQALAKAVSDPASSQYRGYLSHDEYVSDYAPTADQVSSVSDWLTGAGLSVTSVGPDNHYVSVSGTADGMKAAFGAQLAIYAVNGKQAQAPTADLSVPESLSGSVLAVTGLSTLGHLVKPADLGPPAGFVNATPCSSFYGEKQARDLPPFQGHTLPYAVCGYTPAQFRGTYGIAGTRLDGHGQTVAITDAFDASTLEHDANTYAHRRGDPGFGGGQFSDRSVPENADLAADCGGNGWYGEQTLDIEAVHGMATGANVAYYGAASCYDDDLLASLAQATSDDDASIVTNSWGEPTFVVIDGQLFITIDQTLVDAYESVFLQGAVQGIGFYFSSGDNGDEQAAYGYTHPDWPAGDPWVTAVGGTSLGVDRNDHRQFETGWGTAKWSLTADGTAWTESIPFQYGAGGGYSQIFPQPFYQDGVVTSNPTGGRAVPDIAMDADPTTGMLVGETQSFAEASFFGPAGVHYGEYRVGGTSLASPLMAGAQAVAQEGAGARIGFANPLIYGLALNAASSHPFYDVQSEGAGFGNVRPDFVNGNNNHDGIVYSVRTFDQDSSLVTGQAWDDVTGVGTVTSSYLQLVDHP